MPYFGLFEDRYADDKDVDLSKLSEGKIIINGEEKDAGDMISDYDRLSMFNECSIQTKKALLRNIDSHLKSIQEDSKDDTKHSHAYYVRYEELIRRFREKVDRCEFPDNLEDWWHYEYSVYETGVTLKLCHVAWFDVDEEDIVSEDSDTVFELLKVNTKLLTVEQYAHTYGVTATTVRQWIRRGKLRSAVKMGSEWRIPELSEVRGRGYLCDTYYREEYIADLPSEYEFFNDYDYVSFMQNKDNKDFFDVSFGLKHEDNETIEEFEKIKKSTMKIQLDKKAREKFELYLIGNPFVRSAGTYITSRG